jgi:YfiH family protein
MTQIIQAENIKGLRGIRHRFFTRQGGWSKGIYGSLNCAVAGDDHPNSIMENRKLVADWFEVAPLNLLSLRQVHGNAVVTVTDLWTATDRPPGDAMVTRLHGLALGILTADCVPVLFADAKSGVVGAAHAGWRGAFAGVLENTITAMENLSARREDIHAALGPCIWQDSYEVSGEFYANFLSQNRDNEKFFVRTTKPSHYMFDLPGYVIKRLERVGVANIAPSAADTFSDEERFYSFRRATLRGEGKAGSLISTIMLQ